MVVRAPGEIHDRTDTDTPGLYRVVVVSHELYQQGTGMVFACPVYPDTGGMDHPLLIRFTVGGIPSMVVADHVYRMPAAGLGDKPVGAVDDAVLEQIRLRIRGIFN